MHFLIFGFNKKYYVYYFYHFFIKKLEKIRYINFLLKIIIIFSKKKKIEL